MTDVVDDTVYFKSHSTRIIQWRQQLLNSIRFRRNTTSTTVRYLLSRRERRFCCFDSWLLSFVFYLFFFEKIPLFALLACLLLTTRLQCRCRLLLQLREATKDSHTVANCKKLPLKCKGSYAFTKLRSRTRNKNT